MDVEAVVAGAEGAMNVRAVYGEIYEKNGISILPVAKMMGGAGGGEGEDAEHREGKGSGFGMRTKATGVYVIRNDYVQWKPALDLNRVILGGQAVAIVALLTMRSIFKARMKSRCRRGEG